MLSSTSEYDQNRDGIFQHKSESFQPLLSSPLLFFSSPSSSLLLFFSLLPPLPSSQEFFAYGAMNFGGAFFGSFPTAGALSRTILQDATGGNTQLVGFISSGIVILVILFLGSLFGSLPNVRSLGGGGDPVANLGEKEVPGSLRLKCM